MFQSYLLLGLAVLGIVVVSAIVAIIDKYTKFNKLNYWIKQIIFGLVFGAMAILGTHLGIPFHGAQANVRDAPVIIAGLMFGWPAGLISGFIGGFERFFGVYWFGIGSFTQIACSVSTVLAGIVSALLRKFMFDDKKSGILSGFLLGLVIEVFHLLMVFVTNASEYQKGFKVVEACTPPMLIGNSIAVLLGILLIKIVYNGKKTFQKLDSHALNNKMNAYLGTLVGIAFCLSTVFLYAFQNEMEKKQTAKTLQNAIQDTVQDVSVKIGSSMLTTADYILIDYENDPLLDLVVEAETYDVTDINIVNNEGIIIDSNNEIFIGFDLNSGAQSKEILDQLNSGKTEFVQEYMASSFDENIYRKYASKKFSDGLGFIQIGFGPSKYEEETRRQMINLTENVYVGDEGGVVIFDGYGEVLSCNKELNKADVKEALDKFDHFDSNKTFEVTFNGVSFFCRYYYQEGYNFISVIPVEEANLSRNIALYVNTFLEVVIFGLVFVMIYLVIKLVVNNRLSKINKSLEKITNGDLNEVCENSSTTEFNDLSIGINNTVDALKGYIDEAAKRIDAELAFAKSIQASALPNIFPAYPHRTDFDVYALMQPAKEVGGDFYDFYLSRTNIFNFTIADVSGKGIPAALFMMRAKAELKNLTGTFIPLDEVFNRTNNTLVEGNTSGMFVTAWQASINLEEGLVNFVNAGHNPPLIMHKDGKFEFLRSKANMVLAMINDISYNINKVKLDKGDVMFLYTDGVTECVNNELVQFGEQRLLDALNSRKFDNCEEICKFIMSELTDFAEGAAQFDDITMLAFKYIG